eukprot:scaffold34593_cov179-Amphora_coffeaeformis.AAC.18
MSIRSRSNRFLVLLLALVSAARTGTAANLRTVSPAPANATEAKWHFPLHEKSGTQHVHIWIGEPPTRQTLIVDTGSRFSATACEGCRDCGVHASPYLPRESSTRIPHQCNVKDPSDKVLLGCRMADQCVRNACQIVQQYTEGSTWTAVEVNDIVALGEEHMYEATWDGTFIVRVSSSLTCTLLSSHGTRITSHHTHHHDCLFVSDSRHFIFVRLPNRSKGSVSKTIR